MQLNAYLTSAGRVALRSRLPLVSQDSKRTWVQLAYEGEWEGHSAGPFAFSRSTFARMVENFERQANPVPLTYEHPEYAGDGKPIPAAGWIHELAIREGKPAELWGLVEFTDRGAGYVKSGEYRFVSVVVGFESIDRATGDEVGPELFEVGLTNSPFLDGMQPIQLSRRGRAMSTKGVRAMSDVEIVKAAIKALGEDASIEQLIKWIEAKKQLDAAESGESEEAEELPPEPQMSSTPADAAVSLADPPEPPVVAAEDVVVQEAAAVDFGAAMGLLSDASGLDEAALIALIQEQAEQIGAYLQSLVSGQPSGTAAEDQSAMSRKLSMAQSQITRLQYQVKALADEKAAREKAEIEARELAAQTEAEGYVDTLIGAGKILDAERADIVKLARADREWLDRFVANRQIVPVGDQVSSRPPAVSGVSEDEYRQHPDYQTYARAFAFLPMSAEQRHALCVERIKNRANGSA